VLSWDLLAFNREHWRLVTRLLIGSHNTHSKQQETQLITMGYTSMKMALHTKDLSHIPPYDIFNPLMMAIQAEICIVMQRTFKNGNNFLNSFTDRRVACKMV
jgi:hypothetical protein